MRNGRLKLAGGKRRKTKKIWREFCSDFSKLSSVPLYFTPTFDFSDGKLSKITLWYDHGAYKDEELADSVVRANIGIPGIQTQLITKYGEPAQKKGVCETVTLSQLNGFGRRDLTCTVIWRQRGYSVTWDWVFTPEKKEWLASIAYAPISAEL